MQKTICLLVLLLAGGCAGQQVTQASPALPVPPVAAQPVPGGPVRLSFDQWKQGLRGDAMAKGVSQQVFDEAFTGVVPSQEVLDHDHTQPEQTKSFADYLKGAITQKKIDKAQDLYASHGALLARIEAAYGVPAPILLSLWGTESGFGRIQGHYSIIEALATLAYDGRRSAFFRTQLIDALLILQTEHIPAAALTGSWAGAMGQTQFMPSSFLSYAVDFNGDGVKDIWHDDADALASIANYLHSKGWNPNATWGMQVRLPDDDGMGWAGIANQEKPLAEWQEMGITRLDGTTLPAGETTARLVLPDGDTHYAYLTFANYKVIMDWNHSTYFATAIGLLADSIEKP